jgi:hypothetical protein
MITSTSYKKNMYPADADWVNMHMRCKYPVPCVPREGSDEYVLSESAFWIVDDRDDNIRLKHARELANQLSTHHIPNEATSMFHNVLVYKPRVA